MLDLLSTEGTFLVSIGKRRNENRVAKWIHCCYDSLDEVYRITELLAADLCPTGDSTHTFVSTRCSAGTAITSKKPIIAASMSTRSHTRLSEWRSLSCSFVTGNVHNAEYTVILTQHVVMSPSELTQIIADVSQDPTLPRTEDHPCPK